MGRVLAGAGGMHQAVEGLRVRPGFEAARVMTRSRAVQAVPLAVSLSWPPAQAGAAPRVLGLVVSAGAPDTDSSGSVPFISHFIYDCQIVMWG